MSRMLDNPEVLEKLGRSIAHIIDALRRSGMIAPHTKLLDIEVTDAEQHHFWVHLHEGNSSGQTANKRVYTLGEYEVGVIGGGSQSRSIAEVVVGTIKASLQMLEPNTNEVLW